MSPVLRWPRFQGCHSHEIVLVNWSRVSFNYNDPAGACSPAHRELRFWTGAVEARTAGSHDSLPIISWSCCWGQDLSVRYCHHSWLPIPVNSELSKMSYLQLFWLKTEQWCCLLPPPLCMEAVILFGRKQPVRRTSWNRLFPPSTFLIKQKIHMLNCNWTEELYAL